MATFLLAFGALFSIVNPLSGAFIFFGATHGLEPKMRAQVSRWVAIYAFCIVAASLYIGAYVLSFFGISIPVLRVAGGIIVSMSGWRMLTEPDATEQRRSEAPYPRSIDVPPSRLAFYPLTMPLDHRTRHHLGRDLHRRRAPERLSRLIARLLRRDSRGGRADRAARVSALPTFGAPRRSDRCRPARPSSCGSRRSCCSASAFRCSGMAPRSSWAPCRSAAPARAEPCAGGACAVVCVYGSMPCAFRYSS